jgi:hypothetical protein
LAHNYDNLCDIESLSSRVSVAIRAAISKKVKTDYTYNKSKIVIANSQILKRTLLQKETFKQDLVIVEFIGEYIAKTLHITNLSHTNSLIKFCLKIGSYAKQKNSSNRAICMINWRGKNKVKADHWKSAKTDWQSSFLFPII